MTVVQHHIEAGGFCLGNDLPLALMAGPCVIEGEDFTLETAEAIAAIAAKCSMPLIFKSSFDKANRTSAESFRGPGVDEGLRILGRVRNELGVPVMTDVHTPEQAKAAAAIADVLQTPAFLCRQTDFIQAVAACGKPVNIKKGQFLAPWDMRQVLAKAQMTGNEDIMLCERGVSFGYNRLIADMCALVEMEKTGQPVVFDATHSVQQPGGLGTATGGSREHVPGLARAAVAAGVAAVFMEVHPNPDKARSDGPNSLALDQLEGLLNTLKQLDEIVKAKN